jgi:hypothetical protein
MTDRNRQAASDSHRSLSNHFCAVFADFFSQRNKVS